MIGYNYSMGYELHIRLHEDVLEPPDDILGSFPFEEGQAIISTQAGFIVVDLGTADDTTYVQDWYLNSHDSVFSFYVVEE